MPYQTKIETTEKNQEWKVLEYNGLKGEENIEQMRQDSQFVLGLQEVPKSGASFGLREFIRGLAATPGGHRAPNLRQPRAAAPPSGGFPHCPGRLGSVQDPLGPVLRVAGALI